MTVYMQDLVVIFAIRSHPPITRFYIHRCYAITRGWESGKMIRVFGGIRATCIFRVISLRDVYISIFWSEYTGNILPI